MGVDFCSKNKHVSMCYSSFGDLRRVMAKSFDPEFSKIYDITYKSIDKLNYDAYNNACIEQDKLLKEYLLKHNDSETAHIVEFFMMCDCDGSLKRKECKRVLKYLIKAYEEADGAIKTALKEFCCYYEMKELLEDGIENNGISWS